MANTATFGTPDPGRVLSGQVLQTSPDEMAAAAAMHNWLLAEHGVTACVSQGWPDGAYAHNGAKALGTTHQVQVLSDRHDLYDITINYTAVGAAPAAIFTASSVSGGDVKATAALGAGGPVEVTIAGLQIDVTGDYDDITIEVESTVGQTVTIHDLRIEPQVLASPLPVEAVGGVAPLGVLAAGADMPHTSRLNLDLLSALPVLRARPRMIWQWSGIGSGIAGATGADDLQEELNYRAFFRIWPGADAAGAEYTLRCYVDNSGGALGRVYVNLGDQEVIRHRRIPISIAAGFVGYKTVTFRIADGAYIARPDTTARRPDWPPADGSYPYAATYCQIVVDTNAVKHGFTSVSILQLAITGE